ncbi:MAG: phosphatidate cytidylyltransferase [Bosea sp. (in: a-proteobacteria)]
MSETPPMPPVPTSDLRARAGSAIVMAVVILIATWVGGWPFRAIWAAVGGLVAYEWLRIIGKERSFVLPVAIAVALLGLAASVLPIAGTAALTFAGITLAYVIGGGMMAAAGVAYAAVITLAPAAMRDVPGIGMWLIIWSFAVVWLSDIAAYFAGRKFGGPKLMPKVSPKKTWSGATGGLIAGVAGGLLVWWLASRAAGPLQFGWIMAAIGSAVATVLGQMGDLAESAFKRHYGVKDSSHIIPGHGGFMDRLDAYWSVVALAGAALLAIRFFG